MRRPVLHGLQQRREIGHRAVVQVRRAQPDAVERHRDVAVGRSKVRELPVVAFAVGVVGGGRRRRPHLEAMAVGADFLRRDDGAGSRPAWRVARRALGRVHLGAGGRERLVDRERVLRRRHVLDVVLNAAQARRRARRRVVPVPVVAIHPFGGRAVADRRRQHDFFQIAVQAVPVIGVAAVLLQVPERHHVRVANRRVDWLLERGEFHGVEWIDAPAAPVRIALHPGIAVPQLQESGARPWNDHEPIKQRIHRRQADVLRDLGHQGVGGESRVRPARDQETEVLLLGRLVRRPRGVDRRRIAGARAEARGVAHRAVDADAWEADRHARQADGQFVPISTQESERCVPAGTRQVFGKHPRQDEPDPIGHALFGFGADRSVEEMLLIRSEIGCRLFAEEMVVGEQPGDCTQDDDDGQHEQLLVHRCAPTGELFTATDDWRIAVVSRMTSGTKKTRSK